MVEGKTETENRRWEDSDMWGEDLFGDEEGDEVDLFGNIVCPSFELDEAEDLFGDEEI